MKTVAFSCLVIDAGLQLGEISGTGSDELFLQGDLKNDVLI